MISNISTGLSYLNPFSYNMDSNQNRGLSNVLNMQKVTKIALGSIAIFALASIPAASAGPIAYASCMAGCAAMGPFAPACWPACLVALAAPTP